MEIQLPKKFSYTSLSTFESCPLSFAYKYVVKERPKEDTLPLAFGNLVHKCLQIITDPALRAVADPFDVLEHGWRGEGKLGLGEEVIPGLEEIRERYFDDWIAPDIKTGATYTACLENLRDYMVDLMQEPPERFVGSEVEFEIVVDGHKIIGSIDSVRQTDDGRLEIIDYKSGRKPYDSKKLASPLQHWVYSLALKKLFPQYELAGCAYHHVLVPPPDNIQVITSKGWQKRCDKKLHKIITELEKAKATHEFPPKPSPLCHWCSYCKTNPIAQEEYKNICPYHALWTRDNPTWEKAQAWIAGTTLDDLEDKRNTAFVIDF